MREHGVLGVECSNHSVPTIFFNDLPQSEKVGIFHVYKITPTFTPTDILDLGSVAIRKAQLCSDLVSGGSPCQGNALN